MTVEPGMRWHASPPSTIPTSRPLEFRPAPRSLWGSRWPAIALQVCIDQVEAAPADEQNEVRRMLPCKTCPENVRCLNAKRKEIGSLMFGREFMTVAVDTENSLFPESLLNPLKLKGASLVEHWIPDVGTEAEWRVVQGWDIAWSEKAGGDYLVCMSGAVHVSSNRRILLNVERWQRVSFLNQIKLIIKKHHDLRSRLVIIETDAAQQVWKNAVEETSSVPVLAHAASEGKHSFEVGVPSLLVKLERRQWEIPWTPGTLNHEEVVNFFRELEAFNWVDGQLQGVGEHDDTVMAFWHLNYGMDLLVGTGGEQYRGNQPGKTD